jgi:hypothetical protein
VACRYLIEIAMLEGVRRSSMVSATVGLSVAAVACGGSTFSSSGKRDGGLTDAFVIFLLEATER